jgi:type IV secretion system protein VirB10
MRLAMRLPNKKGEAAPIEEDDPRMSESAEVIDLASRSGFSPVVDRKAKTEGLGLAAGVALVFGLGAVTLWSMNAARLAPPESTGNPDTAAAGAPATAAVTPATAPASTDPAAAPTPVPGAPGPVPAPAPILSNPPLAGPAPAPQGNPFSSPSLIHDFSRFGGGSLLAAATAPAPAPQADSAASPASAVGGSAGAFASAIGGVGGGTAQAGRLQNPSTTVTKGTLIPAVLETAINTDVPGFVRAVVTQDVRSFDGKRVLIPRSSRLIGQYQSGVQQGQKRAYVIWTDLTRPDGVTMKISSPAVGFDGTTGLAGDVDTHFLSRFGSGLLLSVVGGLGAIATGGVGGVIVAGGSQAAANNALQQDGQRPPTIRVPMGEPIRVFTARDLDFSTVTN